MLASEYATTIINAHQLQLIAMNTAAGYTLGQNVNASATGNGGDVWGSSGFAPIGNLSTPFTGKLNEAGNTISGLTINLPSGTYVGLFGNVGTGAMIQNVGLVGGTVSGATFVGELAGYSDGTVTNSYASGSVSGSYDVGGLMGENGLGSVNGSYATGSVTGAGNSSYVGGLVGLNGDSVSNSYATGNVNAGSDSSFVGRLAGGISGPVSNIYASRRTAPPMLEGFETELAGSVQRACHGRRKRPTMSAGCWRNLAGGIIFTRRLGQRERF